jgi:putative phosphonate catabolism associated alcohol dehydrogenase
MKRSGTAAVFSAAQQPLEIRRFDVPEPEAGETLVRVTACTICGSDLHTYEGRRIAPTPSILGHEIIGRIESLGPGAPLEDRNGLPLAPGNRLTWSIASSCGQCFFCLRSLPQKCEKMIKYGHERLQNGREFRGGLAEYCVLAPGTSIFRIPDSLSDETVCPANCATATVAAALREAGDLKERAVLIQGAGTLGVTACAMARVAGAAEVICCDINPVRLSKAEEFGATHVAYPGDVAGPVRSATSNYGVDVALEMSGSPAAFEIGARLLRIGGTYVLVGGVFPAPPVAVQIEDVIRRLLSIRGVHNYTPEDLRTALDFLRENHRLPFASLIADWLPLAEANEAFRRAKDPTVFRMGIRS